MVSWEFSIAWIVYIIGDIAEDTFVAEVLDNALVAFSEVDYAMLLSLCFLVGEVVDDAHSAHICYTMLIHVYVMLWLCYTWYVAWKHVNLDYMRSRRLDTNRAWLYNVMLWLVDDDEFLLSLCHGISINCIYEPYEWSLELPIVWWFLLIHLTDVRGYLYLW